jgi:glycerophosphoryl diester phosphodiesterase
VVAHRGASGNFPENTLLAFAHGLADGADALELDVRTTADNVPVVLHDESLDRTTNGTGLLRSTRFADLRRLDAGRGERIPSLSEVLEQFPQVPIILEVKEARATQAIKTELVRHDARTRVLVGGFEHAAIAPFGDGWSRSASRREVASFWAGAKAGLPWWVRVKKSAYVAFTVPECHGRWRVVDARFTRRASVAGKPVHVWTVDDVSDGRRLRGIGVNGIITNFPARFRENREDLGGRSK